jgi:hypothetical protein
MAAGFERTPSDESLFLAGHDQIVAAHDLRPGSDAGTRARIARTLALPLGYMSLPHGPPYTAWQGADGTLFLSMLPGTSRFQPLLTIEMRPDPDRITLVARWTSTDQVWAPLKYEEFRESLGGLLADRRGIPLAREATLKVLIDRGAQFGFPLAPVAGPPETLCGWVREEPSGAELTGWDRDPMLVDPSLDHFHALVHTPTRSALVPYRIQGSWPDEALRDLRQALDTLLPGRSIIRQLRHGCARLTVFLGVIDPIDSRRVRSPYEWNRAGSRSAQAVLDLCAVALARAKGTERGLKLDPPRPAAAAPQPDERTRTAFRRAENAMGNEEIVDATGDLERIEKVAGIEIRTRLLDSADIRGSDQLRRYVLTRESAEWSG